MYLDVTSHRDKQHIIYLHYLLKIVIFIKSIVCFVEVQIYIYICIKLWLFFLSISRRSNECSPGNSNLDVFVLFYTFSCCFLGIFICQQKRSQSESKSGYLVEMNKK